MKFNVTVCPYGLLLVDTYSDKFVGVTDDFGIIVKVELNFETYKD